MCIAIVGSWSLQRVAPTRWADEFRTHKEPAVTPLVNRRLGFADTALHPSCDLTLHPVDKST
eukprot:4114720-Pleurochrysis_carterae.AAC.1